MGEMHRTFTVYASGGLCNRLKVLLSGRAIAEATGREFCMEWRRGSGCACEFERLFRNDWNTSAAPRKPHGRAFNLSMAPWNAMPDFLTVGDTNIWVRFHDWLIRPARYPHQLELQVRCRELLDELSPVEAIADCIESFRNAFFRERMIGVHLRRGDFVLSRPDTAANLKPTLDAVDGWLDELPNAGILLCTDDGAVMPLTGDVVPAEGIVAHFEQRYGSRVVRTQPRSLDRRRAESIQDAVVDLWLLRATDRFVGTAGSSFSELVMFGREISGQMTAGPTARYARESRWLKRTGIGWVMTRLATREFGTDAPYTLLRWRYKERLMQWQKRLRRGRRSAE